MVNANITMPSFLYVKFLLIHAESAAEIDEIDQNIIDRTINLLRERAGVAPLDMALADQNPDPVLQEQYPNVQGDHIGTILEIRRERRVELAFEDLDRKSVG